MNPDGTLPSAPMRLTIAQPTPLPVLPLEALRTALAQPYQGDQTMLVIAATLLAEIDRLAGVVEQLTGRVKELESEVDRIDPSNPMNDPNY